MLCWYEKLFLSALIDESHPKKRSQFFQTDIFQIFLEKIDASVTDKSILPFELARLILRTFKTC
jgi:hypothetical protein